MSTALSPLVSEFETTEQEASYTAWLRAKVAASLCNMACGGATISNWTLQKWMAISAPVMSDYPRSRR